jgi:predicted nucleotidyltransferase
MIYSLEQIKDLSEPIARKYQLQALWVFGSYARGEATEESDIDFLMDYTNSIAMTFRGFMGISEELKLTFSKKIDLISTSSLYTPRMEQYFSTFVNLVTNDKVLLYEKSGLNQP